MKYIHRPSCQNCVYCRFLSQSCQSDPEIGNVKLTVIKLTSLLPVLQDGFNQEIMCRLEVFSVTLREGVSGMNHSPVVISGIYQHVNPWTFVITQLGRFCLTITMPGVVRRTCRCPPTNIACFTTVIWRNSSNCCPSTCVTCITLMSCYCRSTMRALAPARRGDMRLMTMTRSISSSMVPFSGPDWAMDLSIYLRTEKINKRVGIWRFNRLIFLMVNIKDVL